jgi:hypothetical protein
MLRYHNRGGYMFTVLFFTLIFVLMINFIAQPWVRLFHIEDKKLELVLSQLVGFSALLLVSFIVVALELPIFYMPLLALVLLLCGFIFFFRKRNRSPKTKKVLTREVLWPAAISLIPATLFARLMMNGLFGAGFTTRHGPDLLGWSGASLSLCRGETLSSLSESVQSQLGQTPIEIAFIPPAIIGSQSLNISQIASFSDQISAEFLLGAHRTGIPGLLGAFCSVSSEFYFSYFIGLIQVWAILMLGVITFLIVRSSSRTKFWAISSAIVIPTSFGILSVGLEGGVGLLISLPYFLACCWLVNSVKIQLSLKVLVVSSAFLYASTTYIDLIFVLAPLIFLSIITNWHEFSRDLKNIPTNQVIIIPIILILSLSPASNNIVGFTSGFLSYSGNSGWNQGRSPLPSNILGLTPWLPSDGFTVSARTVSQWFVDTFFSIVLLAAIWLSGIKRNLWILCCFLLYGYLFVQMYLLSESPNNYRLWKLASYMCVLLPLLLVGLIIESEKSRAKFRQIKQLIALILLFSSFSSTLVWMTGWMEYRRGQISQDAASFFKEIASKYDVIVDLPRIPSELALYGDLHYGLKSRGGGLETNFSFPERSTVIVRPSGHSCDSECDRLLPNQWKNISYQNVDTNPWFTIQKVSHE